MLKVLLLLRLYIRGYWVLMLLVLLLFYRLDFSCFTLDCPMPSDGFFLVNNFAFSYVRNRCIELINSSFPSPHSELLLGMTVGIDNLSNFPKFKEALKNTGTIHVVVVSGFNISLVFDSVVKLLGSRYKLRNVLIAQFMTFLYAVLSGFESPVVRSLVMGSILSWGKYYGRGLNTLLVLIISGLLMILIQPLYFFNLSFRLSFMATLGLILFSDIFKVLFKNSSITFIEDFSSGLSAQLLVWPLIAYYFGTVSVISLIVNTLILWTVSFTTIFGSLFLIVSFIHHYIGYLFLIPLYVLLDIFVKSVFFFNQFTWGYFEFKLNLFSLLSYYVLLFGIYLYINKKLQRL